MRRIFTWLLLAAAWTAAAQETLLNNGDFEQRLEGWNPWGGKKNNITIIEKDAYSGKLALRIAGIPDRSMTGVAQGGLSLTPGKSYRLTFSLKPGTPIPEKLRLQAAILERGERGKVQKQHHRGLQLNKEPKWSSYTADFTLSDQPCKYYQLIIKLDDLGEGEYVELDTVILAEQDINAILERDSAQVEAKAEALLDEMKKASVAYQRRTGRTVMVSRAQLKYGLERNDYLHKWIDRPLLVDPSLPHAPGFLNENVYRVMQKLVKSSMLDGFAFFPESKGRQELYDKARLPGAEMTIMTEINSQRKPKFEIIEKALNNPQSLRIDGKLVLTSYPSSDDLNHWRELRKQLVDKFGDQFVLMPFYKLYPADFRKTGPDGSFSAADLEALRQRLRNWLRVVDGVYRNVPALKNRRYYAPTDRDIIIPLIHSVLMEDEFKHKYLAWGTKVGHENFEWLSYGMDSTGTGMLRGTMETAVLSRADIINCVEWDEQNENTSFRPTLYNSFSTMRILRHFRGVLDGEAPPDLPGDDLSIPNIVLSYRKILVAGQILELELLNIPDRKPEPGDYRIELVLKNLAGNVVRKLPEQQLSKNELTAVMLEIPVEDIVQHQVLVPELTVHSGERTFQMADGFQPIELRASWNWDYKWVKQPLRDIIHGMKSELKVTQTFPDGTIELTGSLAAPELLNSIEIMDNGDVAYSEEAGALRETADQVVLCINLQAKDAQHKKLTSADQPVTLNGSLEFRNIKILKQRTLGSAIGQEGAKWNFKNVQIQHMIRQIFVVLPRREIEQGELVINLPGYVEDTLKLDELLELGVKGYPGPGGFNLVVRRFNSQILLPNPLNRDSAQFTVRMTPLSDNSVLHLQAVGKTGKVYRGSPVSLYKPSGETGKMAVYSMKHDKAVRIELDRRLLTDFNYLFNPRYGSVLYTAGGRQLLGISGGYLPQVVGRGSGGSSYGNAGPVDPGMGDRYAKWTPEGDAWSLDFRESYVSLPQALVPPFGSFDLTMEIWPRSGAGTQALLGCDSTGFQLVLANGVPTASIYQNNHYESGKSALVNTTGPAVKLNAWNRIRVRADQQTMQIWVNDQPGSAIEASGYQRYTRMFGLGVDQRRGRYFNGKIRQLRVRHEIID